MVRGAVADYSVVGGAPAKLIRRYEPGVGWVGTRGDVRPLTKGHFGGLFDEPGKDLETA